jgi:hypothetical protein
MTRQPQPPARLSDVIADHLEFLFWVAPLQGPEAEDVVFCPHGITLGMPG